MGRDVELRETLSLFGRHDAEIQYAMPNSKQEAETKLEPAEYSIINRFSRRNMTMSARKLPLNPYLSTISVALLLTAVMLVTPGCLNRLFSDSGAANPESQRVLVEPGIEFELGIGETVQLKDTETELTFAFVSGDSRCPADVTCIWEGEASILISVNGPDLIGYQVTATIPGLVEKPYYDNPAIEIDGFSLQFLQLKPYPRDQVPMNNKDYRARFLIKN